MTAGGGASTHWREETWEEGRKATARERTEQGARGSRGAPAVSTSRYSAGSRAATSSCWPESDACDSATSVRAPSGSRRKRPSESGSWPRGSTATLSTDGEAKDSGRERWAGREEGISTAGRKKRKEPSAWESR